MRIGLLKETKFPVDNRVALSPRQAAELMSLFPGTEIVAQSSDIRAFTDDEYRAEGVSVVNDLSNCDILLGIKEARIDTLIPNKKYVFFGHFAKEQEYNRGLLQALIKNHNTFLDYEYMVDDNGDRVCAFGWWAGAVGVYYSLWGYGLKTKQFNLPRPDKTFTLEQLKENLRSIQLPKIKILLTGAGRVSHGAQAVLKDIGAHFLSVASFLNADVVDSLSYTVVDVDELVIPNDGSRSFSFRHFTQHPAEYSSHFMRFAQSADLLICCHFWAPGNPVYLSEEDFLRPGFRIKMIGDVTCDIMGSVKSTIRSSTHDNPFYDYNPVTRGEEDAFSSDGNITVMAVDTCPNALALDTSAYFGEMLLQHVFPPLILGEESSVIAGATILQNGSLTPKFAYLESFAKG